jgi:hypothetical protein
VWLLCVVRFERMANNGEHLRDQRELDVIIAIQRRIITRFELV